MSRSRERILVSVILLAAVVLSVSQTILYAVNAPAGTVFPLIHNYIEDYYYYLHLMRQGYEGGWLATSWLTPEVFSPVFVNFWFIFLGHLARITGLWLPTMYTFARMVGGATLLFLSYLLVRRVYPMHPVKRIAAMFFVAFGTYFWGWEGGKPTVAPLVHLWTELDPLFRWSYIPHHLWSKVFMLVCFLLLERNVQNRKRPLLYLYIIMFTFLGGFSSPVTLVTVGLVLMLWLILELVVAKKIGAFLLPWFLASSATLAMAVYHRIIQHGVFPWTSYLAWEQTTYHITLGNYFQSLGPLSVLFLLGLPVLLRQGREGRLLVSWAFASWVGILISASLPLSNIRFIEGYQQIPIGIGAVAGVWKAAEIVKDRMKRACLLVVYCLVLVTYFSVGIRTSWKEQVRYFKQNQGNPHVYIPTDLMETFAFLEKRTPRQSVVLAPYWISTMIPALTGNRVVAGHALMTLDLEAKRSLVDQFFGSPAVGTNSELEAFTISYILTSDQRDYSSIGAKLIFQTPTFRLYTFH